MCLYHCSGADPTSAGKMFQTLCRFRTKQNETLDRRVRLMSEILTSVRAVKLHAYETHPGRKVRSIRQEEIKILQQYGVMRATINSLFDFVPVVAIVCKLASREWLKRQGQCKLTLCPAVTFITYSLTGHDLSPSIIFPALQYFGLVAGEKAYPCTFSPAWDL